MIVSSPEMAEDTQTLQWRLLRTHADGRANTNVDKHDVLQNMLPVFQHADCRTCYRTGAGFRWICRQIIKRF